MKAYTTKSGAKQYKPALAVIERSIKGSNSTGWCLACGKSSGGIEPDARRYECEHCGAAKVFGGEELVLMGLYH